MAPRHEVATVADDALAWQEDDFIRYDVYGVEIDSVNKKHRVTFRDDVVEGASLEDVKTVESIKPFLILMRIFDDCLHDDPLFTGSSKKNLRKQESADFNSGSFANVCANGAPPISASPSVRRKKSKDFSPSHMFAALLKTVSGNKLGSSSPSNELSKTSPCSSTASLALSMKLREYQYEPNKVSKKTKESEEMPRSITKNVQPTDEGKENRFLEYSSLVIDARTPIDNIPSESSTPPTWKKPLRRPATSIVGQNSSDAVFDDSSCPLSTTANRPATTISSRKTALPKEKTPLKEIPLRSKKESSPVQIPGMKSSKDTNECPREVASCVAPPRRSSSSIMRSLSGSLTASLGGSSSKPSSKSSKVKLTMGGSLSRSTAAAVSPRIKCRSN